ncbi:hypothetical protein EX30DRAFT_339776 [Ascodesmis nigricans]|uniref:Globin-sensor domain-containing protein n=1 Tax=Ascodesmis nigricans TaxID=341454 RepID=A0A4S2N0K4_9PEZI|nr:hypothetical protein EX30DRAFT_339776 [Ascodesmis nigricans]
MSEKIQHISPASLSNLSNRVSYLRQFINFTPDDEAALHAAAPVVAPLVPAVVDAVYTKLLSFDITASSFTPRQTGYTGNVPTSVNELSHEHPQIKFRKDFLKQYLVKLVTLDFGKLESWEYLDKVGLMHTGVAGFKHRSKKPALRVEYIHCGILLGFVEDIFVDAVITHPDLDIPTKNAVARAVNKLIWIQNDLFARHYVVDESVKVNKGTVELGMCTLALGAASLIAAGAVVARFLQW